MDDQALFIGYSRESHRTGRGGRQRASRCHDLHGERGECGALVAAASEDGQRRGWEDGGPSGLHSHWKRGWLMERIAAEPEVTVRGLMTELAERGVAVSYGTVWNFIHREGMSFKKSVRPAEQDRPDVARRRARWKKYQTRIDPARLVFIDETWVKTNMAPIRR